MFPAGRTKTRIVFEGCLFSVPVTRLWAPGNFGKQNLYFIIIFFSFLLNPKETEGGKKVSFVWFFFFFQPKIKLCNEGEKVVPRPNYHLLTLILAQISKRRTEGAHKRGLEKSCVQGTG